MLYRDFTVVVAVDSRTVEFLEASLPTWRKNRPWLLEQPMVCLYDRTVFEPRDAREIHRAIGAPNLTMAAWPPACPCKDGAPEYASQRERMLSAFVYAPLVADIHTSYFLKIDADVLALESISWPLSSWFDGEPAWVASPWNYTKPADQMATLDSWANDVQGLREFPPLNLPYTPGERRCRHRRMCSWMAFFHTEWSRGVADLCRGSCGPWKIPVPSEDGLHWYVSARRKDPVVRVSMKRFGFDNFSRLARLRDRASEVLNQE